LLKGLGVLIIGCSRARSGSSFVIRVFVIVFFFFFLLLFFNLRFKNNKYVIDKLVESSRVEGTTGPVDKRVDPVSVARVSKAVRVECGQNRELGALI
jgi:hypothetical protein